MIAGGWSVALAAAGFWVGIASASLRDPPSGLQVPLLLLVAGACSLGLLALFGPRRPAVLSVTLVAASFALLGAGWGSVRVARVRGSPLLQLVGRPVEVSGSLVAEPAENPFGWSASFQVREVRPSGRSAVLRVNDTVWLRGERAPPPIHTGNRLVVKGWLHAPRGDFGAHLVRRGHAATMDAEGLEFVGPPGNPLVRLAHILRSSLRRSLERILPGRGSGLLMGLALGDTSRLDPVIEEDFRATGLSHLTAVSGQNVAMFLAPILGVAAAAGAGRHARLALGFGTAGFFVLLTGAQPSVLRATAMAWLTLLGVFLGRPRSPPAILGGAVLGLLAVNPTLVHAVGFQLSVAATAGIALLAGPLAARLAWLPRWLSLPIGATLGAQAGVLPLLLYHFGVVPTVAVPANFLALPAVAPAMLLGLLAGVVGLALPALAGPVGLAARVPLRYLEAVAHELARSPLPSITSGGGQAVALLVGLGAVGAVAWWLRTGRRLRGPILVTVAAALPGYLLAGALRAGPPGTLTVTFFEVGQGDAALVRSSSGATVLVDGGPEEDVVARKLAALGIKRLDLLVASHPHADHVAGLPTVLARFRVALAMDSGCEGDSPFHETYQRALEAVDVAVRHPPPGSIIWVGELRVEVLGPLRCHVGTESDPNNDSLVLRVSEGPWSILFPGDAEEPAQQELLGEGEQRLEATLLKVPHHGGATSLEAFFDAVDARAAVVSVGPNTYGHPVADVLLDLAREGMRILRTDRLGDITVSFGAGDLLIESSRG